MSTFNVEYVSFEPDTPDNIQYPATQNILKIKVNVSHYTFNYEEKFPINVSFHNAFKDAKEVIGQRIIDRIL